MWTSIFFLPWDNVLNHHHANRDITVVSIASVFFKKGAIIIATHGQKTLDWQLSKAILAVMYNGNFEAINKVLNKRMKKLEMEYGQFICTIIFYLILYIRFRKELLMLSLR